MTRNPIRRAQLIAPSGVGSMMTMRDGTSMICGGLDHWYRREDGTDDPRLLDSNEFRVEEWRLQQRLGVRYFRLPPDYRTGRRHETIPNTGLTIPFLRFPQWHFCPRCARLYKRPLAERGKIRCAECESKGERWFLAQVRFVAVCDRGHIQDFPWREWVHRSEDPGCQRPMRLIGTGGASLGGIQVRCECGVSPRSLAGIMDAAPGGDSTTLSNTLIKGGGKFLCQGQRPWLGTDDPSPCDRPLRGSLRNASNVYFALVRSAIYLPRGDQDAPQELIDLMEQPQLSQLIELLSETGRDVTPQVLRQHQFSALQPYSDEQIEAALTVLGDGAVGSKNQAEDSVVEDEDRETTFRRAEFEALRTSRREEQLSVQAHDPGDYAPIGGRAVADHFSRIMLVNRLRETRALAGFHRIFAEGPEDEQGLEEQRRLLWKNPPAERWLPAYIVHGEGIFLEFNEALLQEWERQPEVRQRLDALGGHYQQVQQERRLRPRAITPRMVLLHTFSHLLINRLIFECGYSSAALRERLYVSADRRLPMAGVLIYTASGDSEGTLGGLVRMGKPGYLEPVIRRALEGAAWCSADPVCMEMGRRGGQGPDSCNLAACHSCGLVPETTCEEFNRFLDRAVVVGDPQSLVPGFFEVATVAAAQ